MQGNAMIKPVTENTAVVIKGGRLFSFLGISTILALALKS